MDSAPNPGEFESTAVNFLTGLADSVRALKDPHHPDEPPYVTREVPRRILTDGVAGFDYDASWQLRASLSDQTAHHVNREETKEYTMVGLIGLNSERAHKAREGAQREGYRIYESAKVLSLRGVDTPEAWQERRIASGKNLLRSVALSLGGLNTPESWEMRRELHNQILLARQKAEAQLAEMNQRILKERDLPSHERFYSHAIPQEILSAERQLRICDTAVCNLTLSLAGIDSPIAWHWRSYLQSCLNSSASGTHEGGYKAHPSDLRESLMLSLVGCDSESAWKLRNAYLSQKEVAPDDPGTAWDPSIYKKRLVLRSLGGIDSPRAWALREQLRNEAVDRLRLLTEAEQGITALQTKNRDRQNWDWPEEDRSAIKKYLDYIDSQRDVLSCSTMDIAKSLAGLNSPKAWLWRHELYEGSKGRSPHEMVLAINTAEVACARITNGVRDAVAEKVGGVILPELAPYSFAKFPHCYGVEDPEEMYREKPRKQILI